MANRKTALVTGASDGIGAEFSDILAGLGYNVILVARREDKLNELSDKLNNFYGVDCTVIPADLSEPQAAQKLFSLTQEKNLEVDLLINNAGLLHNGYFTDLGLTEQERMIAVNVLALTSITHLFANNMATRGKGRILNISSLAAWMAIPNQNVYAASKAYVLSFTQALADEMMANSSGVSVTALCPGYTATKMMDNTAQGATLRIPPTMMMSAREVAEAGIKGCLSGKSVVVPGVANKITAAVVRLFSKRLLTKLVGSFYRSKMQ
jgi:short-subunit dehydrogenase